jgi:hypothetical protein
MRRRATLESQTAPENQVDRFAFIGNLQPLLDMSLQRLERRPKK